MLLRFSLIALLVLNAAMVYVYSAAKAFAITATLVSILMVFSSRVDMVHGVRNQLDSRSAARQAPSSLLEA